MAKKGFVTFIELKPRSAMAQVGKAEPMPGRKRRATKPKRRKRKKS